MGSKIYEDRGKYVVKCAVKSIYLPVERLFLKLIPSAFPIASWEKFVHDITSHVF